MYFYIDLKLHFCLLVHTKQKFATLLQRLQSYCNIDETLQCCCNIAGIICAILVYRKYIIVTDLKG